MKLQKVNIGANRYVHKFKLADKTIVEETTTKTSYDNLTSTKPTKTDATWFMSSIRIGFDTPTGELSDGEYATQENGFHWVKIPGYDVEKVRPEYIKDNILSKEGETRIKE